MILSSAAYISQQHSAFVSIDDVQSVVCASDRVRYGLRIVIVCWQITFIIFIMLTYRKVLDF